MKTKINRFFSIVTIITLLLLTAGCSDMTAPSSKAQSSGGYTLTGSIGLGNEASRSAASSFATVPSAAVVQISAVKSGSTETTLGSVGSNQTSYTITIPTKGTWTITATLSVLGTTLGTGQATVTIGDGTSSNTTITKDINIIMAAPQIDSTKTGSINLKIKNSSTKASSIIWHWIDEAKYGGTPVSDMTQSVTNGNTAEFSFSSVNSGAYNVELLFKNSSDTLVYSCYETISVFPDYITDTWYGDSPYINESNEFEFTDEIAASFAIISSSVDIQEGDPLYLLWSLMPEEADTLNENPPAPLTNVQGLQFFSSITENMVITDPMDYSISRNYCFDGTTLYAPPFKYKNTYAGFGRDSSFDLSADILNLIGNDTIEFPQTSDSCFADGYLCFNFVKNETINFIGCYDTVNQSLAITSLNGGVDEIVVAVAVKHKANANEKDVLFYITQLMSQSISDNKLILLYTLYCRPFYIEDNVIKFYDSSVLSNTELKPASVLLNDYINLNYTNINITDIEVVGDNLYILVYTQGVPIYGGGKGMPTAVYQYYTKTGDDTYELACDSFISNGGILKFDLSSSGNSFEPESWTSSTTPGPQDYARGLYMLSNDTEYYSDEDDDNPPKRQQINGILHVLDKNGNPIEEETYVSYVPVQPPLVSGKANPNYFYGPRKILGTAQNGEQLLIVDDGGFVQFVAGSDSKAFPVNRIVTVDVESGNFVNTVDVGLTFDSSFNGDTFSTN